MLFGAALFISAIDKESKKRLAAASVLGFLAAGGALNVTAFCCSLYLLIALQAWGGAKGNEDMRLQVCSLRCQAH